MKIIDETEKVIAQCMSWEAMNEKISTKKTNEKPRRVNQERNSKGNWDWMLPECEFIRRWCTEPIWTDADYLFERGWHYFQRWWKFPSIKWTIVQMPSWIIVLVDRMTVLWSKTETRISGYEMRVLTGYWNRWLCCHVLRKKKNEVWTAHDVWSMTSLWWKERMTSNERQTCAEIISTFWRNIVNIWDK